MSIPMQMPRFSISRFPGFCQFRMEKKEFAIEMKTLHDFPYFLIISSLFTWILGLGFIKI